MERKEFRLFRILWVLLFFGGFTASVFAQNENLWKPVEGDMFTRWMHDVDPEHPLPEYPRPQMERADWKNLNGLWQYKITEEGDELPFGTELDGQILVPFAIESALSGVKKRVETDHMVYRHTFTIPDDWEGQNMLLHFGAVDWEATTYINGEELGTHRGGFDGFSYDITEALKESGEQEIVVEVFDPVDDGDQPYGKQRKEPGGIYYTPVTGIWQTVWLEPVPEARVSDFNLVPDIDEEILNILVECEGAGSDHTVEAIAYKKGEEIGSVSGKPGEELALLVPSPELWSADNPFLYDLEIKLMEGDETVDHINSYFGMREVSIGKDREGHSRIMLNGEPVFQLGPLDQGYWPDGLYTAPTDVALRHDLEMTKKLGFNMNRKHVKVEPDRWYYWADKLGVLIWQDMVTGDYATPEGKKQFETELKEMVTQFDNHPSIISWIIFNEGWGQFDTERITQEIEQLDPSRIVTDASGWQHHGAGDIVDVHRYPGPAAIKPTGDKAAVVGEFGGVGYVIDGHSWAGEGWGYQNLIERPEVFINRYEDLIHKLYTFYDDFGVSAGVYTQITDLETEINGLITYDREVVKGALKRFQSVNKGITPFIGPEYHKFMESADVHIKNWAPGMEIRYTLDGSEPTMDSNLFTDPIELKKTTTVRARAFKDGDPAGYASEETYEKVEPRKAKNISKNALKEGLKYNYYESSATDRATYKQHWPLRRQMEGGGAIDAKKSGVVENFALSMSEQDEIFGVDYSGYIYVPESGVYTFYIEADDDAKLFIGDDQIFDRMGQSPATAYDQASIVLEKGYHPVSLNYFQAYGPKNLAVMIKGPGMEKQPIANGQLFHTPRQKK